MDGWLPSVYYAKSFQTDDRLQIGGWGDIYRTYIQFDLKGLPAGVVTANLLLYSYPRGDRSVLTPYSAFAPNTAWATTNLTTSLTWATQPQSFTAIGSFRVGSVDSWWPTAITSLYNSWQNAGSGARHPNNGLVLVPAGNNNNFDVWRSSRYGQDAYRPILQLAFTPPVTVPDFKMPLPGNLAWLATTEVGGWDCFGSYDSAHDNANYFSIDFSWQTKQGRYADPNVNSNSNVPVLAAADGVVTFAGSDPKLPQNGNFVVVQHAGGFSTRYLHLKKILAVPGKIAQGTALGYMGNSGTSPQNPMKVHLHFGVRYNDSGAADSNVRYVVMDGWLLKSYQTECSVDGRGNPLGLTRYYTSSNRP